MVKNLPAIAGDVGSILGSERSPALGCSCLENPMDRGAWWGYSPWGHRESDATEHQGCSSLGVPDLCVCVGGGSCQILPLGRFGAL